MPLKDAYADELTQPFWDGAQQGKLIVPSCTKCGTCVLPAQPRCFECRGTEFAQKELPGTGTIYTFTVVRHPLAPHLSEVVPFVSGVIDLDGTQGAGARLILNIVDCDPETVKVGDKVRVFFDPVNERFSAPRCRPV